MLAFTSRFHGKDTSNFNMGICSAEVALRLPQQYPGSKLVGSNRIVWGS